MTNPKENPPWLTFVDRAPDEAALLRLMILNPVNDAPSVFINHIVDTDPGLYRPGPSDLHTSPRRELPDAD